MARDNIAKEIGRLGSELQMKEFEVAKLNMKIEKVNNEVNV